MNTRAILGLAAWSICYYSSLALSGLYLGIGVTVGLFALRHMMFGIPAIIAGWQKVVLGTEQANRLPPLQVQEWPNRVWVAEALIYGGVALLVLLRFNVRLVDVILG